MQSEIRLHVILALMEQAFHVLGRTHDGSALCGSCTLSRQGGDAWLDQLPRFHHRSDRLLLCNLKNLDALARLKDIGGDRRTSALPHLKNAHGFEYTVSLAYRGRSNLKLPCHLINSR